MSERKNNWMRDFLLVPIIVGLVIAIATYLIPNFFDKGKQISYTVEDAVTYLDKSSIGNSVIKFNDIVVPEVFAMRVRLWNSGDVPLKDLAVRFEFYSINKEFRILSVNHNTRPSKEFGAITEKGSEDNSKRYIYQLLNPKDEDSIVFLANSKAELKVFSKAEGLNLKNIPIAKDGEFKWYYAAIGAGIASMLSSFVEFLIGRIRRKRKKDAIEADVEK